MLCVRRRPSRPLALQARQSTHLRHAPILHVLHQSQTVAPPAHRHRPPSPAGQVAHGLLDLGMLLNEWPQAARRREAGKHAAPSKRQACTPLAFG